MILFAGITTPKEDVERKILWAEKWQWWSFLKWYNNFMHPRKSIIFSVSVTRFYDHIDSFFSLQQYYQHSKLQLNAHFQIESTKPDKFTPRIAEKKDDYVRVEYESPILGVSAPEFRQLFRFLFIVFITLKQYLFNKADDRNAGVNAACGWCWILVPTGQELNCGVSFCISIRKLRFWL